MGDGEMGRWGDGEWMLDKIQSYRTIIIPSPSHLLTPSPSHLLTLSSPHPLISSPPHPLLTSAFKNLSPDIRFPYFPFSPVY
jgi:hypothetical protein